MDWNIIKKFAKDNLIWFTSFIYIIIIFYASLDSADTIYKHSYFYGIIILAPILLAIFYTYKNSRADIKTTLLFNARILIPVIGFVLAIGIMSAFDIAVTSFFTTILLYSMFAVAAIISAKIFESYLYSLEGYTGILARIVLFIPCMLNDLFNFIVGEFARSPFVVYVLLGIELALFAAYKLLPKLLYAPATNAGHVLKREPVLLKNETKCPSMVTLNPNYNDKHSAKKSRAYSFWVYLVEMPPTVHPYGGEANIFSIDGQTRCKITYKKSESTLQTKKDIKNNCCVYLDNVKTKEFSIKPQRWTYIVINDQPHNLELFLDSKLIITHDFIDEQKKPIDHPPLNASDFVVLGQNDGLQGGICNVQYFSYYLGDMIIKRYYSMYKDMDPPIDKPE